ncbi:MAG: ABC transporter substrate-binding protein, partial [Methanosarcinaceae archaeon]|nr:ABC transporter substrate-binding protein [Methanosarcinaceae archaeon]
QDTTQHLNIGIRSLGHADGFSDPAIGWTGWFSRRIGVYENLIGLDHDMNLKPWLATSWSAIDDDTWRFQLREGVTFHDGTTFEAEDVKYSLNRLIDENSAVFNPRAQPLLNIENIEVIDEHTIDITTNGTFAPLIYHLTDPLMAIISPESVGKEKIPVGTGPFKFINQEIGVSISATRFDDYWDDVAKLNSVTFKLIPDATTRAMALEAGDIDIALSISPIDAMRLKNKDGITIEKMETTRAFFLILNTNQTPLDNKNIRQAISYAINRDGIVDAVLEGIGGTPAGTLFPHALPWANRDIKPIHNVSVAKNLLDNAGLKDSDGDGIREYNRMPLQLDFIISTHREEFLTIGEIIKSNLKEIGIEVTLETYDLGAVRERRRDGDFSISISSWGTAPSGDPAYILDLLIATDGVDNHGRFSNQQIDELLERGRTTVNVDERIEIYNEIQVLLNHEKPIIPLYHQILMHGMRDDIKGLYVHPAEMYLLHNKVYIAK